MKKTLLIITKCTENTIEKGIFYITAVDRRTIAGDFGDEIREEKYHIKLRNAIEVGKELQVDLTKYDVQVMNTPFKDDKTDVVIWREVKWLVSKAA